MSEAQPLLTEKSLAMALAPPRAPPVGTAHHSLMRGEDPSAQALVVLPDVLEDSDGNVRHPSPRQIRRQQARARMQQRLLNSYKSKRFQLPHPHLPKGPEIGDQITRFLGTALPVRWHNRWRDHGEFRYTIDTIVPLAAPFMATRPAIRNFRKLTSRLERYSYGSHPSQFLELYLPDEDGDNNSNKDPDRLVFFIHGGAWGSGKPYMYRLVAAPFVSSDTSTRTAVAVVGYRTYPDATNIEDQINDCHAAAMFLAERFPQLCRNVAVMGHSSGAHVGLLMLVEHARQSWQEGASLPLLLPTNFNVVSFVGLSGPYNISHHFDYEAGRGVEELSPMKAINGYTRENFLWNSPAMRLQQSLRTTSSSSASGLVNAGLPPRILLVHGMSDDTVPFTATSECGRILRSCGVTACQELYLADVDHQETVTHLMLGGPTADAVLEWMNRIDEPTAPRVLTRSKL